MLNKIFRQIWKTEKPHTKFIRNIIFIDAFHIIFATPSNMQYRQVHNAEKNIFITLEMETSLLVFLDASFRRKSFRRLVFLPCHCCTIREYHLSKKGLFNRNGGVYFTCSFFRGPLQTESFSGVGTIAWFLWKWCFLCWIILRLDINYWWWGGFVID